MKGTFNKIAGVLVALALSVGVASAEDWKIRAKSIDLSEDSGLGGNSTTSQFVVGASTTVTSTAYEFLPGSTNNGLNYALDWKAQSLGNLNFTVIPLYTNSEEDSPGYWASDPDSTKSFTLAPGVPSMEDGRSLIAPKGGFRRVAFSVSNLSATDTVTFTQFNVGSY